jgi:hypothetical protein
LIQRQPKMLHLQKRPLLTPRRELQLVRVVRVLAKLNKMRKQLKKKKRRERKERPKKKRRNFPVLRLLKREIIHICIFGSRQRLKSLLFFSIKDVLRTALMQLQSRVSSAKASMTFSL